MRRIFWAGDSTVKTNTYETFPQTGLGQGLGLYLERDVQIVNHAENGRSTKSFLDEGRMEPIRRDIKAGDHLFIQFGHNDEKKEDPTRFTEPFGSYQENLKQMADAAKEKGAYPVLITPLYRRRFDSSGQLIPGTHLDYPRAMKELAEREQVPCIDLCAWSYQVIQEEGPEKTRQWFMEDNTHLRYEGAVRFSALIAEGLEELGGHYRSLLLPSFGKSREKS